jgi:hypothetical protein
VTFAHYSVRRLNPFGGIAQVIAGDVARAISLDGARWEIQVLAEAPNDLWGSLNRHAHHRRFFRFGIWSLETGLRRVPVNPIMDIGTMLDTASPLMAEVEAATALLPFPLTDALELWLLDGKGQPLALLMSATPGEDLSSLRERRWCAAPMSDRNLGCPRHSDRSPVADDLESLVRRVAGPGTTRWFRRTAPGTGAGFPLEPAHASAPPLDAGVYPELPLPAEWTPPREQALVDLWIEWAAPRLLCLPYLSAPMRTRLEKAARQNALEVSALWRIYPHEVDPELIRTARVESRLRRAAETA